MPTITRPQLIAAKAYVATGAAFVSVFLTALLAAPEIDLRSALQALAAALGTSGLTGLLTYNVPNVDTDDPARSDDTGDNLPEGAAVVADDEVDDYPSPVLTPGAHL